MLRLTFWFDIEFAGDLVVPGNFVGLGFDRALLFVGTHRSLQGDLAILRDDLYIVRVRGERLVAHQGTADLLGEVPVRTRVLLLVRGGLIGAPVALVHFAVVGRGRGLRGLLLGNH